MHVKAWHQAIPELKMPSSKNSWTQIILDAPFGGLGTSCLLWKRGCTKEPCFWSCGLEECLHFQFYSEDLI